MQIPSVGMLFSAKLSQVGLSPARSTDQASFAQQYASAVQSTDASAGSFNEITVTPTTGDTQAASGLAGLAPLQTGFYSSRASGAISPPLFIPASEIGAYTVPGTTLGEKATAFAKNYVGLPYIYGGTSLTTGVDCSGFVSQVYKHIGYNMPRSLYSQADTGTTVDYHSMSDLKPGDLLFFKHDDNSVISHVTMYIGDGKIIHASCPETGVIITKLQGNWERNLMLVKRIG